MQLRIWALAGLTLMCSMAAAAEPWHKLDGLQSGLEDKKMQCHTRNILIIRQMRPLLRRLLLGMVSLQQCKDNSSRDICNISPSKFQRHHHCRLLTLSQHSAQICTDELQCKQSTALKCSSAWRSNVAALQWLFPRHTYCGDAKILRVSVLCNKQNLFRRCKVFTLCVQFPIVPIIALRKIAGGDIKQKSFVLTHDNWAELLEESSGYNS